MADFHFIRPLWLLAIFVLILVMALLKRIKIKHSGWQNILPPHLAKVLVANNKSTSSSIVIPFIIGLIAIIAMAGPSWKKLPQPVYQTAQGSVLIMDMSYSMYATDVSPNRLTRARYKAIDLLDSINDGEIGLIAYAGDAFSISPLTDDVNNIKLLLPSLSPDLMPALGSNPLSALALANEMLINAGHNEGDIYWFTDGIDNIDIQDLTQWSREHPYRINILGIGTPSGAPIKLPSGELMKDDNGAIIVPKLTKKSLQGIAQRGNGQYKTLTHNNTDIEQLIVKPIMSEADQTTKSERTGDQWQEFGPYFLLLILPFVLSYFRRGVLTLLLPCTLMLVPNKQAHADIWQDLWKTKDQQGQVNFKKQQYQQAAEQFNDPLWQGSSHYKAGNYEQALSAFQQVDSAGSLFNQGNALAKLQKIDEAIDAYNEALSRDPTLADAKTNKEILEKIKEQQEQQKQDQQSGDDDQQNKDGEDQEGENKDGQSQENQDKNSEEKSQDQQNSDKNSSQDSAQDSQQDSEPQDSDSQKNEQQDQSSDEKKSEEQQKSAEQQAKEAENSEDDKQQSAQAQLAAEQQAKETEQKNQQLLNKVTDDPYTLLRNKMQIEYQKRRRDRRNIGVKKKW